VAGGARQRPTASARKARASPEPAEAEGGVKGNPKGRAAGAAGGGGLDAALSRGVHDAASRCVPRGALKFFEHAGSGLLWFPLAVFLWLVPVSDTFEGIGGENMRGFGALLFFGMLIDLALVGLLKVAVRRPRPAWNKSGDFLLVASADQWSFPSGHASRAAQVFLWLVCCARAYEDENGAVDWTEWYTLVGLTAGWALATTLSRVALGRHYVSDTLAGICVGTALVAVLSQGTFNMDKSSLGTIPVPAGGVIPRLTFDTEFLITDAREQIGAGRKLHESFVGTKAGSAVQEWVDRVNDAWLPDLDGSEPLYRAVLGLPKVDPPEEPSSDEDEDDFYFDPVNADGVPIDSQGNAQEEE